MAKQSRTTKSPEGPTERFMNAEQLSAYIPFSIHAIYRLVAKRAIPHIKKGRRVVFDRLAIDRWLEQSAVKPRRLSA
jgi:excisionase family DNA binding protein